MDLLRKLIALADGVPDLSFAGFKVLWTAHALPLLHLSHTLERNLPPRQEELRLAQELQDLTTPRQEEKKAIKKPDDFLDPPEHQQLRQDFKQLVELLVTYAHAAQDPADTTAGRLTEITPPQPRMPQCCYTVFCLYVLHATQPFLPKIPIRLPQHAWTIVEALLSQFAALQPTLHAAHVLAKMHKEGAFEFTFDFPRSVVRNGATSDTETAEWQPEWLDEELNEEQEAEALPSRRRLDDPRWYRTFAHELNDLAIAEKQAYASLPEPPPVHLDNIRGSLVDLKLLEFSSKHGTMYHKDFQSLQRSLPFAMQHRAAEQMREIAEERAAARLRGCQQASVASSVLPAASTDTALSAVEPAAPTIAQPSQPAAPYEFLPMPTVPRSRAVPVAMPTRTPGVVIPAVQHAGPMVPNLDRLLVPPLEYRSSKGRAGHVASERSDAAASSTVPAAPTAAASSLAITSETALLDFPLNTSRGDDAFIASLEQLLASEPNPASADPADAPSDSITSLLLSMPPLDTSVSLSDTALVERPLQPYHMRRRFAEGTEVMEEDDEEEHWVFPQRTTPSEVSSVALPTHPQFLEIRLQLRAAYNQANTAQKPPADARTKKAQLAQQEQQRRQGISRSSGATITDRIQRANLAKLTEANKKLTLEAAANATIPQLQSKTSLNLPRFYHYAEDIKRHAERTRQEEALQHEVQAVAKRPGRKIKLSVHSTLVLPAVLDGYMRAAGAPSIAAPDPIATNEAGHAAGDGALQMGTPVRQTSSIVGEALADLMTFHPATSSILRTPINQPINAPQRSMSGFTLEGGTTSPDERKEDAASGAAEAAATDAAPPAAAVSTPSTRESREAARARMKQKKAASASTPVSTPLLAPSTKEPSARRRKAPAAEAAPAPPLDPATAARLSSLEALQRELCIFSEQQFESGSDDEPKKRGAGKKGTPRARSKKVAQPPPANDDPFSRESQRMNDHLGGIMPEFLAAAAKTPGGGHQAPLLGTLRTPSSTASLLPSTPSLLPASVFSLLPPSSIGLPLSAATTKPKPPPRKRKTPTPAAASDDAQPAKSKRKKKGAATTDLSLAPPDLPPMAAAAAAASSTSVDDGGVAPMELDGEHDEDSWGVFDEDFDLDVADDDDERAEADRLASQPSELAEGKRIQAARADAVKKPRKKKDPSAPKKPRQKKGAAPVLSHADQVRNAAALTVRLQDTAAELAKYLASSFDDDD